MGAQNADTAGGCGGIRPDENIIELWLRSPEEVAKQRWIVKSVIAGAVARMETREERPAILTTGLFKLSLGESSVSGHYAAATNTQSLPFSFALRSS